MTRTDAPLVRPADDGWDAMFEPVRGPFDPPLGRAEERVAGAGHRRTGVRVVVVG